MTISTVLILAGPSTERELYSFTNKPHHILNAWLTEEQKSQIIESRMAKPPIGETVYSVVIASLNPENVLYPVHIKPVEFTREMFEAGSSAYPDIREADTLIVLMKIDKESKLGSQFVLERVNKMLTYCRRQHPTTPLYIIGVMEELFERGLTPMEYNLQGEALQLAQQYQASYFECNQDSWDSWLAKDPETTQKSVLNRIYQLEVDRFKQSLDSSQLQAYQTQNRLPEVDLRTEYDRGRAISAMVAGLKDATELKKRMRELPNTAKGTIDAEKLADQHRSGFWKKYDQFCARHELNQQRFNQLSNDLVYLEQDDATRHAIYHEMRLLRQKIVEAELIFHHTPVRIKWWEVPKTTSPQPQYSDTEQSSSDESHSPKGSPPRQTPVSSARPPAYNPAFQAKALPAKPEPSAPPISQKFTSNAGFFRASAARAESASAARVEGPRVLVRGLIDKKIRKHETEKAALQTRETQLGARIKPAIEVIIHQINCSYVEAFNKQDRVHKVLHKVLKRPERKQADKSAGKQTPYSKNIVDNLVTNKLNSFANVLVKDTYSYVTADRLARELKRLLEQRTKNLMKTKTVKSACKILDEFGPEHTQVKLRIRDCETSINFLKQPDTFERLVRDAEAEERNASFSL